MALSVSSSSAKTVMAVSEPAKVLSTSPKAGGGVVPLPVKPTLERSAIQRTKSRKPVKKISAIAVTPTPDETVVDEIATTSGEVLEGAVESVVGDAAAAAAAVPAGSVRVRKSGKASTRTNRRRALVMCLALGMVRPCASNVESDSSNAADLRRTASESPPALQRTASRVPSSTLLSQVSLATTMKQTNFLGEKEDLQKLTSLQ